MKTYSLSQCICFAFAGAGVAFGLGMQLAKSHVSDSMFVLNLPEPHIEVYDCDNFAHAASPEIGNPDHPAYYAFQRLKWSCEQNQAMLVLMQIWEQDPMAGVVYEPAPK